MSIGNSMIKLRTNKDENGKMQVPSRRCKICQDIVLNTKLHLKKNHPQEYDESMKYDPSLSFDESAFRYLSYFEVYTKEGWKNEI